MTLALLRTRLQVLERRLVTLGLVFGGLETVFEGRDQLFFLQEVLLQLGEEGIVQRTMAGLREGRTALRDSSASSARFSASSALADIWFIF